jgi:hypothetical protein
MAFTRLQLSIGQNELEQLANELASLNLPDAITNAVVGNDARVRAAASRYVVDEGSLKRIWNALVLWELYTQLPGPMPEVRQTAYDEAMKELNRLRDGKATEYPLVGQSSGAGATWGGCKQF